MHITVRLFARLRELAGASEVRRDPTGWRNVRAAWDSLVGEFSGVRRLHAGVSCAVNEEYARMTTPLAMATRWLFCLPVSGG